MTCYLCGTTIKEGRDGYIVASHTYCSSCSHYIDEFREAQNKMKELWPLIKKLFK